jgi:fructosamine-3-kinase
MDGGIRAEVSDAVGAATVGAAELDGGEVGTVHRVALADGRTVVAKTGPTPLTVEAGMVRYLDAESPLPVPTVLAATDDLLVLEYVPGDGAVTPAVERDLADRLAALHGVTADRPGFPFDTLTGSLRLPNPRVDSWVEFVREFRLRYVLDRAVAGGAVTDRLRDRVEALAADLGSILVEPRAPALLHGDVWTGNLVVDGDRDRVAALLDPACFYGHPEYELAYVRWTDTGGEEFFGRYRERRGLDPGADRRMRAYAVVPILVHCWYFGAAYREDLDAALSDLGY